MFQDRTSPKQEINRLSNRDIIMFCNKKTILLLTGALDVKLLRSTRTVGAQKIFTESRSISVIGVIPNIKFGCGKYKH